MTMRHSIPLVASLLLLASAVTACAPAQQPAEPVPDAALQGAAAEDAAPAEAEAPAGAAPAEEERAGAEALPPDPVPVEFEASDGVRLVGTYYPASVDPAPIVVLMHWAGGNQDDWLDVVPLALILQNRQDELAGRSAGLARPVQQRESSYGVLTFNFRGFPPSGDGDFSSAYLDAQAAVQFASTLEGADPAMILTTGASIGADGAVDGCAGPGGPACIGAISLSPGNYIGVQYVEAVAGTGDMPIACVAAEGDAPSPDVCRAAEEAAGGRVQVVLYTGGAHGMNMFDISGQEPVLLDFILQFLDSAVRTYQGQ